MSDVDSLMLLKAFLNRFAPKSSNKRKYSHNEFSFVHTTISKIFLQQAKVEISAFDFAKVLSGLDYTFFVREGESGLLKNEMKRSKIKKKAGIPFFYFDNEVFVYLDISSKTIWELKAASQSINYKKNPLTIARITLLKQEITDFFKNNTITWFPANFP